MIGGNTTARVFEYPGGVIDSDPLFLQSVESGSDQPPDDTRIAVTPPDGQWPCPLAAAVTEPAGQHPRRLGITPTV